MESSSEIKDNFREIILKREIEFLTESILKKFSNLFLIDSPKLENLPDSNKKIIEEINELEEEINKLNDDINNNQLDPDLFEAINFLFEHFESNYNDKIKELKYQIQLRKIIIQSEYDIEKLELNHNIKQPAVERFLKDQVYLSTLDLWFFMKFLILLELQHYKIINRHSQEELNEIIEKLKNCANSSEEVNELNDTIRSLSNDTKYMDYYDDDAEVDDLIVTLENIIGDKIDDLNSIKVKSHCIEEEFNKIKKITNIGDIPNLMYNYDKNKEKVKNLELSCTRKEEIISNQIKCINDILNTIEEIEQVKNTNNSDLQPYEIFLIEHKNFSSCKLKLKNLTERFSEDLNYIKALIIKDDLNIS